MEWVNRNTTHLFKPNERKAFLYYIFAVAKPWSTQQAVVVTFIGKFLKVLIYIYGRPRHLTECCLYPLPRPEEENPSQEYYHLHGRIW
jgi:hypothetical protein